MPSGLNGQSKMRREVAIMRVGLIGSSHVHTPDYIEVCRQSDWIDFVGVAQPDPDTRHMLPEDVPTFANIGDLPSHDVAAILTDVVTHNEVSNQVGAPCVFVEKPLATTGKRAAQLAEMLRVSGKQAGTGFFLRHAPGFNAIQQALFEGQIGNLLYGGMVFTHPGLADGWLQKWPAHLDRSRMGGETFNDLAIHLVDAAMQLSGRLSAISCRPEGENPETGGTALLRGPNEEIFHIWVSATMPKVILNIQLIGQKGELVYDGRRALIRKGDVETVLHDGEMFVPADGFKALLQQFHNDRFEDRLDEDIQASYVMDDLQRSAYQDTQSDVHLAS